jgi:preprotein translocase subunit SecA
MRKHLLEYDDVANDQRKVIYRQRDELLDAADVTETITAMRADVVSGYFAQHVAAGSLEEQWDITGLEKVLETEINLRVPVAQWLKDENGLEEDDLRQRIVDVAHKQYGDKMAPVDPEARHQYERSLLLQSLDTHWREHLSMLDYLRQGIYLRSYAQKNPTQEYKREAFELFEMLLDTIKSEVTRVLMQVQIRSAEELRQMEEPEAPTNVQYQHADVSAVEDVSPEAVPGEEDAPKTQPFVRTGQKIGRNDPCPCGSGKKYKQCHGKLT